MSTNRSRRIDRETAEHLLGGAATGTQDGPDALTDLLAAATAPATTAELAGEEAALTAFRQAAHLAGSTPSVSARAAKPRTGSTRVPRRRTMANCAPARFISAKAAAAALAATALGGVAVAAGTGNLPVELGGAPAAPATTRAADGTAGQPTAITAPIPSPGTPGRALASPAGPASPSSALATLCRSWPTTGKPATDPRFEPLTRAAGGSDRVAAYCGDLLRRPDTGGGTTPSGTTPSGDSTWANGPQEPSRERGRSSAPSTSPDPTGPTGRGGRPTPSTTTPAGDRGDHSRSPATGDPTAQDRGKQ